MKKLVLLLFISLISTSLFAQLKLDENFSYPVGDSLTAHGWTSFSGGSTNRLLVTTPGLVYAGYPLSGIGEATTVNTTGQDAYVPMTSVADSSNADAVYASFMVNVTSAQRPGDYFLALLPSTSTTFFSGRVYSRVVDGILEFGLTKASQPDTNTMVWASGYSLGTTYLLVLKYKFNPGVANNEVSLFIFTSGLPATEPMPNIGPMAFSSTSADVNNIGRVALRQGTAIRASVVIVDGIRVATTWFSTAVSVKLAIQGPTIAGFTGKDTVEIYLHNSVSPFAIVDSAISFNFINGTVFSTFVFPNVAPGTYYLDVRYRHLPVFRNGIETWSAVPITIAQYNGGSYDFTSAASQAFGSNQILVGSIYAMYNGDVNQDGVVDGSDGAAIDNAAAIFKTGYVDTDLDANDFVDGSDGAIADNNASNFVSKITPP